MPNINIPQNRVNTLIPSSSKLSRSTSPKTAQKSVWMVSNKLSKQQWKNYLQRPFCASSCINIYKQQTCKVFECPRRDHLFGKGKFVVQFKLLVKRTWQTVATRCTHLNPLLHSRLPRTDLLWDTAFFPYQHSTITTD